MAHAVAVTDGATTFSISSGAACCLVSYPMASPQLGVPTVTETIEILVTGANGAAVQANTAALCRLLEQARMRRVEGVGPRVYVQVQLDTDGAAWRSEIYDARLDLHEDALAVWAGAKLPASLYIERAPYWEGALTQLALSNESAVDNTSGITVYNHDDSGLHHGNYVTVHAAAVAGDLPAPVKLELANNVGAARTIYQVFIAANAFNTPLSFPTSIEGESTITGGGGTGSDATCSNGQYAVHTGGPGGWSMQFALSSAVMGCSAGYPFHVLVRFNLFPNTIARARLLSGNDAVLAEGEEISLLAGLSQALVDFGVLYLPPGGYSAAWAAHKLQLLFRQATAQTVQVDYILLMPAYGFRDLLTHGSSLANGESLTDDPIEGRAWLTASGVEASEVIQRAGPVTVWPNRDHAFTFAWSVAAAHASNVDDTLSVKAWYRPRRSAI